MEAVNYKLRIPGKGDHLYHINLLKGWTNREAKALFALNVDIDWHCGFENQTDSDRHTGSSLKNSLIYSSQNVPIYTIFSLLVSTVQRNI